MCLRDSTYVASQPSLCPAPALAHRRERRPRPLASVGRRLSPATRMSPSIPSYTQHVLLCTDESFDFALSIQYVATSHRPHSISLRFSTPLLILASLLSQTLVRQQMRRPVLPDAAFPTPHTAQSPPNRCGIDTQVLRNPLRDCHNRCLVAARSTRICCTITGGPMRNHCV